MNRSAHIFAVLVSISGLVTGCIPVVRTSVVHYGVEARLVDARTAEPVAKQRIQVTVDGQEHAKKTDRSGTFKVSPERAHYWAWLMGGPHWAPPRGASIQVTMEGYTPYQRDWTAWPQAEPRLDQDRLRAGYVNLGRIEMGKRPPDGAANRSQPVGPDTNGTSSADTNAVSAPKVAIANLLAHREAYQGKRVEVSGYYSGFFEHSALYESESKPVHKNSLWIERRADFQGNVRIIGTFHYRPNLLGVGHLNGWPAEITNVESFEKTE